MTVGIASLGKPFLSTTMDSVLLVYNTNSAASLAIANYYVAYRPGASNVDVLAITCVTTEQIAYSAMKTDIKAPIATWLAANPTRPKKYVILCMGIPTRTTAGPGGQPVSVSYGISTARSDASITAGPNISSEYGASGLIFNGADGGVFNTHYSIGSYPNTNYLVTHLCMGNSQTIVQQYIDKLASMFSSMSTPSAVISSRTASKNGSNWYFDDSNNIGVNGQVISPYTLITATDGLSGSNAFSAPNTGPDIRTGSNVAFYQGWGVHNGVYGFGDYPSVRLTMTGNSNWYIVSTIESVNGDIGAGQGDYVQWWNNAAFGGTNGSRTPVGMVCHTEEPFTSGCEAESYARNWFKGFNFAECAHSSRSTFYFMAVGDPLVAW